MPNETSIDLIRKLIAFDTTSRLSNLALIGFVQEYLARHGVKASLVYNNDRQKANLYATIGPQEGRGILLSGHTDVVPVEGQAWSSDPFSARIDNDRIFGRGSADMKSFIAVALGFVPELVRRPIQTPIHFSFSYDEEVGCVGVRGLIDILKGAPYKPRMCIVGEPTEMKVVLAHKGKYYMRVHVRGRGAHSSLSPLAVNAIEFAAELITHMRKIGKRFADAGPFDADFDIPHSTIMTGVIHGGTNLNIVPNGCWFDFEIRDLPQDDARTILDEIIAYAKEVLEPEMHATDLETGFDFEEVSLRPSLDTGPDEEVVQFAKSLVERQDHGKVAFGTEAALFQRMGDIPTVVCGPGNIEQAHTPNEFITFEQVAKCEAFMQRLVERVREPVASLSTV